MKRDACMDFSMVSMKANGTVLQNTPRHIAKSFPAVEKQDLGQAARLHLCLCKDSVQGLPRLEPEGESRD